MFEKERKVSTFNRDGEHLKKNQTELPDIKCNVRVSIHSC